MVSEQRFFADCLPYLFCRYVILAPLEHQYPVFFQNSHTLPKSVVYHLWPILVQLSVLFHQPCRILRARQVRRVEYYKVKRIVREWKVCKIAHYVRRNIQCAVSCIFPQVLKFLFPLIAIDRSWVLLVEPDASRSTGRVQDFLSFYVHLIQPFPSLGQAAARTWFGWSPARSGYVPAPPAPV